MAEKDQAPSVIYAAEEEFMLRLIRDLLRASNIKTVGTNRSLKDAIDDIRAHAWKWDVFLIDGNFPDAFESIDKIRQEFGPHIKLLLLMSSPTQEDVIKAHQAGADDFIVLPWSQVDFEDKFNLFMGKKVAPREKSTTAVAYCQE